MDLGLRDRVALVGGASKGIGYGIAAELAAEGAKVALMARSEGPLKDAADRLGGLAIPHDSSDLDAVPSVIERVEQELGPIDIFISNTGGPPPDADPLSFTREQWETAHRTLVLEPMEFLQRLLPKMAARGWGRVVVISSSAIVEPIPALQLSNVHRPGLLTGLHVLAQKFAADDVTLNALLPGRIATDRLVGNYGSLDQAAEFLTKDIPAGRLGQPEDMGAAAAFLCSDRAGFINGTNLLVDGAMLRSW